MGILEIELLFSSVYSEDEKDNIKQTLKQLIEVTLSKNLNIESLSRIIVPEDFGEIIESFQREYGLLEKGYTNNELGQAVGKTMTYCENGVKYRVIIIRKEIVLGIFVDKSKQLAAHTIHHELCHVHDEYYKSLMFTEESRIGYTNDLQHVLNIHSDVIWGEYIACRLSASTIPSNTNFFFS